MERTKLQRVYDMLSELDRPRSKRILDLLAKDGEMTVQSISARLRMEHSNVSQCLSILRKHKVVNHEQEGKFVYYSVNYEGINRINEATAKLSEPARKEELV